MENNLVKKVLDNGGTIQPLLINSKDTNGTGITNPSIFIKDQKIYLNIRNVNYTLYHSENNQKFPNQWGPLVYLNPEDYIKLHTINYITEIDPETYQIIPKYTKIDTTKLDVEPLWEFVGLEDGRLVEWDNKLWLCGVRRDTTTNGEGRMEMSQIVDGKEVSRYRIEPPKPSYCEKNWMPILDMPFHFVKWSNPTEIVKVDLDTLTSETVRIVDQKINFPRDIRGGSQVIKYGDYRVALTHEVDLWKNEQGKKDSQYYHRFIVWDSEWNIVSYSEEFKFMDTGIEFSCGMSLHEGNILITFGFQDNTPFILSIPSNFFEDYLKLDSLNKKSKKIQTPELLRQYIYNTKKDVVNFNLAIFYYKKGHTAAALSFFLRTAEFSENESLIYESLIMMGRCLNKQGKRDNSEKTCYLNAISFNPSRPEAYFYLSQYYESKKEWVLSYTYSNMALEHKINLQPFNVTNESLEDYMLIFQKAVTSWWVGHGEKSRELFFYLVDNYRDLMNQKYFNLVKSNIDNLGLGPHPFKLYTSLDYQNLKYKFNGSEKIKKNYSQAYQDIFVLTMLKGKKNGKYLEIGSGDPFYGNNTVLLENQFGWMGISIDIDKKSVDNFKSKRKNPVFLKDATKIDYTQFLGEFNFGYDFDYLQLDCDPPNITYDILKSIPFDEYRFAVITYEHDFYNDPSKLYRDLSREYLISKGYKMVLSNVSIDDQTPYEDWWVHPDLVDLDNFNYLVSVDEKTKPIQKYMLY